MRKGLCNNREGETCKKYGWIHHMESISLNVYLLTISLCKKVLYGKTNINNNNTHL